MGMIEMAENEDWKEFLSPEAQKTLSDLLNAAKRHKGAYMQAEDVKVAQLWAALVEMKSQLDCIQCAQVKSEGPFRAIVEMGEAEKRKAIERVMREMIRPEDDSAEEATQKMVDSLMKF